MVKTNTRLLWRQEFARAALDEYQSGGDLFDFCEFNRFLATRSTDLRQIEFGLMGMRVKKKMVRCDLPCAISYLQMVEDCFRFPVVRSN